MVPGLGWGMRPLARRLRFHGTRASAYHERDIGEHSVQPHILKSLLGLADQREQDQRVQPTLRLGAQPTKRTAQTEFAESVHALLTSL